MQGHIFSVLETCQNENYIQKHLLASSCTDVNSNSLMVTVINIALTAQSWKGNVFIVCSDVISKKTCLGQNS